MCDVLENARADRLAVQLGRGPAHGLVPETVEWRVAIGTHEGTVDEVARRFGVSEKLVYKLRAQFKTFPSE
jgi:hypothetical protein